MALMWRWQTEFISKSCPTPTFPLPSFPHPWHWAHQNKTKAFHTVLDPHPSCSLVRDCPRLSQPCTPQDTALHSLLLSVALVCCSKGRFKEIGHKGMVSVSKKRKKEQETNALFVRFLCSYCCNSQQLWGLSFFFFCDLIHKPHFLCSTGTIFLSAFLTLSLVTWFCWGFFFFPFPPEWIQRQQMQQNQNTAHLDFSMQLVFIKNKGK